MRSSLVSALSQIKHPKERRFMKLSESITRCYYAGYSFSFMDEEKYYARSNISNALYTAMTFVILSSTDILHLLIFKITTFEDQSHCLWTKIKKIPWQSFYVEKQIFLITFNLLK